MIVAGPLAPGHQPLDEATQSMRRGMALRSLARPWARAQALALFDRAVALRRGRADDSVGRFDLAGALMNRAEVLLALGGADSAAAALSSLDEAVTLLEECPWTAEPRVAERLAIALQNRALASRRSDPGAWTVVPDLFRAISVLERPAAPRGEREPLLLATAWIALAEVQAADGADGAWRRARQSAERALALVRPLEDEDCTAAEVGLRARHVGCRALSRCLSQPVDTRADREVHDSTDLVESGLDLVARWERRGVGRFRAIAADLLEYGRRVYQRFQPHFAGDFERDYAGLDLVNSGPSVAARRVITHPDRTARPATRCCPPDDRSSRPASPGA